MAAQDTLVVDEREVRRFWDWCYGRLPAGTVVVVCDDGSGTLGPTGEAGDFTGFLTLVRKAQGRTRTGVWVSVDAYDPELLARRRREDKPTTRGRADDIAAVLSVVVDVDGAHGVHQTDKPLPTSENLAALLADLPTPTVLVDSGGGWHARWTLPEAAAPGTAQTARSAVRARLAANAKAAGVHVDLAVTVDKNRVMRVPGSWNTKGEPAPVRCAVIGAPVTLADLEAALPPRPEPEPDEPSAGPSASGPADDGAGFWDQFTGPAGGWVDEAAARYAAEHSWVDVLTAHGWTLVEDGAEGSRWLRPGEPASATSATVYADTDRLTVYSDATPFGDTIDPDDPQGRRRTFDKVDAAAILGGHGDGPAGRVVVLRAAGYGPPGPPPDDDGPGLLVDGWTFLTSVPDVPEPVHGDGPYVAWSRGEPVIVAGGVGAGKTTFSGHLLAGRLGLRSTFLGMPVVEGGRVLYLACDRPRQIARNLRRILAPLPGAEAVLRERLVFWPGPPPGDLAQHPDQLLDLCRAAGLEAGDTVFVDGIGNVAVGLTDDEVGAGLNLAFQKVVREGIELAAMHHQRKAQTGSGKAGKPKSLDDVYGSRWITAGAGTVLLLWADEPGSAFVELTTLKPAAEPIGPLTIVHDLDTGAMTAHDRVDLADILKASRHTTLTAVEVAARSGADVKKRSEVERTRRALDRLVREGVAEVVEHARPGGGKPEKHYRWAVLG